MVPDTYLQFWVDFYPLKKLAVIITALNPVIMNFAFKANFIGCYEISMSKHQLASPPFCCRQQAVNEKLV